MCLIVTNIGMCSVILSSIMFHKNMFSTAHVVTCGLANGETHILKLTGTQ